MRSLDNPYQSNNLGLFSKCTLMNLTRWNGGANFISRIIHDDVIKWKHFPRYWPFVWGIPRFPAQKPVMRNFNDFFDLRLNKWLSKHSWGWWFETLPYPLWRHCNVQWWQWGINAIPVAAFYLRLNKFSKNMKEDSAYLVLPLTIQELTDSLKTGPSQFEAWITTYHIHVWTIYTYIYYIYMCVCVCVCARDLVWNPAQESHVHGLNQ